MAIGNIGSALDEAWRLAQRYPNASSIQALRSELHSKASHKEIFDHIYRCNVWAVGSGGGSTPENTGPYHAWLAGFIRENGIRSVVDAGCGDWQSTQFMDWSGIDYLGLDVSSVVLENTRRFASDNFRFAEMDVRRGLPAADLLIMKDVLQHWPNADIIAFLPNLRRYPHCLLTNDYAVNGSPPNTDIPAGSWRGIDLSLAPFNVRGQWVGRAACDYGEKRIFHVSNPRQASAGCSLPKQKRR